jgi:hypothetical protein
MTSQAFFLQPPRIAVWLVNQFTPPEESESILGDLLEEFSQLASTAGVAVARGWYWRQTVKTIVHLAGTGFCVAPWSTAAGIVGGLLLLRFVSGLPDKVLSALTDRYLAYWSTHFTTYMFLGNGRNVDRTPHRIDVGWVFGRVGGQGKGDGCYDDVKSDPWGNDWRCFGLGSRAWTDGCSMDAMVMR